MYQDMKWPFPFPPIMPNFSCYFFVSFRPIRPLAQLKKNERRLASTHDFLPPPRPRAGFLCPGSGANAGAGQHYATHSTGVRAPILPVRLRGTDRGGGGCARRGRCSATVAGTATAWRPFARGPVRGCGARDNARAPINDVPGRALPRPARYGEEKRRGVRCGECVHCFVVPGTRYR